MGHGNELFFVIAHTYTTIIKLINTAIVQTRLDFSYKECCIRKSRLCFYRSWGNCLPRIKQQFDIFIIVASNISNSCERYFPFISFSRLHFFIFAVANCSFKFLCYHSIPTNVLFCNEEKRSDTCFIKYQRGSLTLLYIVYLNRAYYRFKNNPCKLYRTIVWCIPI